MISNRNPAFRVGFTTLILLSFLMALAGDKPVYQTSAGVAIKGYDPVAYFNQDQPVKGTDEFSYQWNGASWHFSNAANLASFQQEPEKYAPQFGGYCAYAVSLGKTASIDPKAWKIVDGKLYLNYSTSIQKKWEADIPGHIASAEKNWPKVLD